jgi:hypothetical protein
LAVRVDARELDGAGTTTCGEPSIDHPPEQHCRRDPTIDGRDEKPRHVSGRMPENVVVNALATVTAGSRLKLRM